MAKTKRITIMVDVEPDTFENTAEGMVEHVNNGVNNGSIILLHVMYGSNQESRVALPLIIDELENAGFSFVTVSELLEEMSW